MTDLPRRSFIIAGGMAAVGAVLYRPPRHRPPPKPPPKPPPVSAGVGLGLAPLGTSRLGL